MNFDDVELTIDYELSQVLMLDAWLFRIVLEYFVILLLRQERIVFEKHFVVAFLD